MGGSSKSNTTTNQSWNQQSQQGELNILGSGNVIASSDADVLKALGAGAFDTVNKVHGTNAALVSGVQQTNADLLSGLGSGLLQITENANKDAMRFVANFTEREQLGASAGQNDALKWVALAAVAVVGVVLVKGR